MGVFLVPWRGLLSVAPLVLVFLGQCKPYVHSLVGQKQPQKPKKCLVVLPNSPRLPISTARMLPIVGQLVRVKSIGPVVKRLGSHLPHPKLQYPNRQHHPRVYLPRGRLSPKTQSRRGYGRLWKDCAAPPPPA